MRFFGVAFLALLVLEILSIVWMTGWIGGLATFILMVIGFLLGSMMLRNSGLSGILLAGAAVRSGQNISLYQMLWPIRYSVAAVLLMSPGFFSTCLAILLLLPIQGKAAMAKNSRFFEQSQRFSQSAADDDVIEGEYTVDSSRKKMNKQNYIEHRRD